MILEIGSRLEAHSAMGGRRLIGKGFLGVDAGLVGCGHLFLYPLLLSLVNFPGWTLRSLPDSAIHSICLSA
jgi:hypothetical protein